MQRLSILGSTGSIGVSTLRLVSELQALGQAMSVEVLVGGANVSLLAQQAQRFRPALSVLADEASWPSFQALMHGSGLAIACGQAAVIEAASQKVDWVMAAISGIAGLRPVWAAAATGAVLALANKESLVCCGTALMQRIAHHGGTLLPVDSEHNAIFQVLQGQDKDKVARLILTASGGPFYGWSRERLSGVTLEAALKHPNWSMGAKITVDSASLANKGLELIEAAYLFDTKAIDVVIHPQSIIHSMVEYKDGSTLAQMGPPDMRIPISYCLGYPDRLEWKAPSLDFKTLQNLTFHEPDLLAFPMLRLAREALQAGGYYPVVYNCANEIARAQFMQGHIDFLSIAQNVESAMMRAKLPSMAEDNDYLDPLDKIFIIEAMVRDINGAITGVSLQDESVRL
jgi:1-deoxy-D-xylulose-5-phosphate reductoisomerase